MELYVGLDVSLNQTSICVVDGTGKIKSEGTVNTEPVAISEFIGSKAKGAVRIGLETGPKEDSLRRLASRAGPIATRRAARSTTSISSFSTASTAIPTAAVFAKSIT